MKRFKCSRCGSIKTILLEDTEVKDVWKAELKCGHCGRLIFEWGV